MSLVVRKDCQTTTTYEILIYECFILSVLHVSLSEFFDILKTILTFDTLFGHDNDFPINEARTGDTSQKLECTDIHRETS